jgi:hypothetical protein
MAKAPYVDDVLTSVEALSQRLEVLKTFRPDKEATKQAVFDAAAAAAENLLESTRLAALGEKYRWSWWDVHWRAKHLDTAYPLLHAAQVQMLDLCLEPDIRAAIPATLSNAREYLDRSDPRRIAAEHLPLMPADDLRRAYLRAVSMAAYQAGDLSYQQQRSFRNGLVASATLLTVAFGALLVFLFVHPTFVPLCFDGVERAVVSLPVASPTSTPTPSAPAPAATVTPTETATSPSPPPAAVVPAAATRTCPTGDELGRKQIGWDIVIVALFGVVGGALSAVVSIRSMRPTSKPFGVPFALSVLKLPSGALFATIGMIAIQAGFLPGLSALDSQAQILAYAVLLGYSQQLITGVLDRRAATLGKSAPSDEPGSPMLPNAGASPNGAGKKSPSSPAQPGSDEQRTEEQGQSADQAQSEKRNDSEGVVGSQDSGVAGER